MSKREEAPFIIATIALASLVELCKKRGIKVPAALLATETKEEPA